MPGPPIMPESREPARPGFAYQPIDTGDGTVLLKDTRARRSRRRCLDTGMGSAFNMLVALVLCANAVFLCLEADLDLLSVQSHRQWQPSGLGSDVGVLGRISDQPGADSKRWGGLESDLGLVGINGKQQADVEANIQLGLKADKEVKATVQQEAIQNGIHIQDLDIQDGLRSGAYNVVEFFFIAFFVLELCCRLCDLGCADYWSDPWSVVDVVVVVAGLIDLTIPMVTIVSAKSTLEQVLRLLRVLRILRLFRVVSTLRIVGKAFLNALYAVIWIFVLIAIINLVCAIFLTTFIGQKSHLWNEHAEEVHAWFGSIGRSMMTLSTVMTLSGWDHIAEVLVNVIPRLAVMSVIFVYILVCGFTVLGLVVGVINTSLISSRLDDEKILAQDAHENRAAFANAFIDILSTCEQAKNGYMSRDEFSAALESHPIVLLQLKTLDISTSIDGLLLLYDRLSHDPSFDGAIKIETLVEATLHLSGVANALGIFDLKYQFQGLRRDSRKQVADVAKELGAKYEIGTASTVGRVDELQHKMESVQHELGAAVQGLAALNKKLELSERVQLSERAQHSEALLATNSKLDTLFSQLNSTLFQLTSRVAAQSGVSEKVDALSTQVAAQATVKERIHDLAVQFTAVQTSVHEKVDALSNQFTQQTGTLERLWPLYEAKLKQGGKEGCCSTEEDDTSAVGSPAGKKTIAKETSGKDFIEEEPTEKGNTQKEATIVTDTSGRNLSEQESIVEESSAEAEEAIKEEAIEEKSPQKEQAVELS